MSDIENLEQVTRMAEEESEEEAKRHGSGTSLTRGIDFERDIVDDPVDLVGGMFRGAADAGAAVLQGVLDVGGTVVGGAAQVGSAVLEHAPDAGAAVLQGALDVGGAVVGGAAQVGSAVLEHAPDVADAAVKVVGTILSGLADS